MRAVILGAGGMLGHKMYAILRAEFPETIAVFRKCPAHYGKFGIFDRGETHGKFDVCELAKLKDLDSYLSPLRPDVIINCIGLTTRKLGAQSEADIALVNSVFPRRLKEWCQKHGKRLVHFSTDCVFSGKNGPYQLDSPRDAKDLYGQSKALGEVDGEGILTIRSSIVGLELEGKSELLEWFLAQKGQNIKGFAKVMYSGVTTTTMAHAVKTLLKCGAEFRGIQQLASQPISKYELLSLANEIFAVDAKIEKVETPISNKILLPSPYFTEHGICPPPWREQLRAVHEELPQYERWFANVAKQFKAS